MAKFFDGKVIPKSPQNANPDRYNLLGLEDTEPNLGVPAVDGYVLVSDTDGVREWVPVPGGPVDYIHESIINAKGDIVVGSAADTASVLTAGTDGLVLLADSASPLGLKWDTIPGGNGIPETVFEDKGDILVGIADDIVGILALGNNGEILSVDTGEVTGLKWISAPSGSGIPETIIDAKGDLIVGSAPDTANVLTVGDDGKVIVADSASPFGLKWDTIPGSNGIPETVIDAKGDLVVGSAPDTADVLTVGDDGKVLVADSASPLGLKWDTIPGGGGGIPETIIDAKGDVIVGSAPDTADVLGVGNNGDILTADSAEVTGLKWVAPPPLPPEISSFSYTTSPIAAGGYEDFSLDLGDFYTILSIEVIPAASTWDTWLRMYLTSAGRAADSRVSPGPPFPSTSTGFSLELVTSVSESAITLIPSPSFYPDGNSFFRIVNQGASTEYFNVQVKVLSNTVAPCTTFGGCNVNINPYCVTNFSSGWFGCTALSSFPPMNVSSGVNFSSAWYNCTGLLSFAPLNVSSGVNFSSAWYNCSNLLSFPVIDVSSGTNFSSAWYNCSSLTSFPSLDVSSGTNFYRAWRNCESLASFPLLDVSSGTNFSGTWWNCYDLASFPLLDVGSGTSFDFAWYGCESLTAFPALDLSQGTDFSQAWFACYSLADFPANMFDTCTSTSFFSAWGSCALTETSVDNILVSLDTAGQNDGIVHVNGGTSAAPGVAGLAAKASLQGKGWTVLTN